MKVTGIVRRIDDLGRVVIPSEIRDSLVIRAGDPLEISVVDNKIQIAKHDYSAATLEKVEVAEVSFLSNYASFNDQTRTKIRDHFDEIKQLLAEGGSGR